MALSVISDGDLKTKPLLLTQLSAIKTKNR